ncbi:ATP-binding cassette domain-containing protein [Siculibacillus lacustris]|uniref:ATP-binding cassette domain-containing protein n=1 Tax=Siculibacillus lacustris TaxID=1549641 RepID=A0A4Q9VZX3_9HYPH|nr:oligopeptide/dipeptide ABC transporter ATP-binding protein [Siculibacillus lacustris]TBW41183.1 ATP-binding cassette domain-containing protein [Siculibacillus lacustris]
MTLAPPAGVAAEAFVVLDKVGKIFAPQISLAEELLAHLGAGLDRRVLHAVDGVDLTIAKGEALGLVGESGCGKSTLGRILAGIHRASEGRVRIDGRPVTDAAGRKTTTRVQTVFQDPFASLDPRMTVGETISEGPIAHGFVERRAAQAHVAEWLLRVGLDPAFARRFPHQFSGGQRQRVAIARALAMRPDVLVCDEPVASLDVSIQAQIVNLFLKLRRDLGLTLLFISHDLGVVRHLCDRVAIMYLGRIVEVGTAAEVYGHPRHPYTRALLDSVPRLRLDPDAAGGVSPISGELPSPLAPPPGCHFHPRCPLAEARCRVERPLLRRLADGRDVACHLATDAPPHVPHGG